MNTADKRHLKHCLIWLTVIIIFNLFLFLESCKEENVTEPISIAGGFLIIIFIYLIVYIVPLFLFRFCIRKKPVFTTAVVYIVAFLYTVIGSAIEILIYNEFFGVDLEVTQAIRYHGLIFFPFILHGGANHYYNYDSEYVEDEIQQKNNEQNNITQKLDDNKKQSKYEQQIQKEYSRYSYLKQECQELHIEEAKKWYTEGKLTEEQYSVIESIYLKKQEEMQEIRRRVKLMQQIHEIETNQK